MVKRLKFGNSNFSQDTYFFENEYILRTSAKKGL